MLDDSHQRSTFRPLVEAALQNHPLQLKSVAQAKAGEDEGEGEDQGEDQGEGEGEEPQ